MKKILLCLLLLGCNEETRKQIAPTTTEQAAQISYYKDTRTNLCFVASEVHNPEYPWANTIIWSNVPCTPEVLRLIK